MLSQSSQIIENIFVNQQEYIVLNKELVNSVNGDTYLKLTLSDNLNVKIGYCFKNVDKYFKQINRGSHIYIWGKYNKKNNNFLLNIHKIVLKNRFKIDFWNELNDIIQNNITDENCLKILDAFLNDRTFVNKFKISPASINSHHCYKGGLLEHTVKSMEMGKSFFHVSHYKDKVDLNILLTGLFLHDIGKIYLYKNNSISMYGKYVGHINLGFYLFARKVENIDIPNSYKIKFANIILSHHFTKNHSYNQVEPKSIEAILVNKIESLNAELDDLF